MKNYYKFSSNLPELLFLFAALLLFTGVAGFPADRRAIPSGSVYNIVSSNLCNPNVKQYSGYIKINSDSYLFFWFFEALKNPSSSPLTLWLNGGPGCSSMYGLFNEVGPCYANSDGSNTLTNSNSWTSISNMLFVDQPIGTGLSYTTGNYTVNSTEQSTSDLYVFLQLFFERFPEYSKLDFHIFGESYAGHYIPAIAKKIVDSNTLINSNKSQGIVISLKSIGMGNAIVSPGIQWASNVDFIKNNSYGQLLNDSLIQEMKGELVGCEQTLTLCNQTKSKKDCDNAEILCYHYEGLFDAAGRSYYDVRAPASTTNDLFNPSFANYLKKPDVLRAIGALSNITYQLCNDIIGTNYGNSDDFTVDSKPQAEFLLQNGVRLLMYNGDADYIVNWFGGNRTASALEWSHQSEFDAVPLTEWCSAGQVRSFDALWFIRMYNSGHSVPYYQPTNSLKMFTSWINNQSLLSDACNSSSNSSSHVSSSLTTKPSMNLSIGLCFLFFAFFSVM